MSELTTDPQGDVLFADTDNDRVQEVAASDHTQFGISMLAGRSYLCSSAWESASLV